MGAVAVPLTTALIRRIKLREEGIQDAGKTMLRLAKEQGEDLIELKQRTPHGGFKDAVLATGLSYRTAAVYMSVAKDAARCTFDPELSLRAYLAERKSLRRPPLTREDAEYALKINALATRGATEGEREAARGKLEGLAEQFGRTPDQLTKEAEKLCPDQYETADTLDRKHRALAKFQALNREQLLEVIWLLLSRKQPA